MKTDIEIIKKCLAGDQLAYKYLYEKYISYCYGMCNRYSVEKANLKDMVQVIFSNVFRSLESFDSEKSQFKTWFTRVCINQILADRRKRFRTLDTQYIEDVSDYSLNKWSNPIEENIDKEYILSLLTQMPENYRVVFNLFIIDGYSHEEISDQLGISKSSSRVLLSRARTWVKAKFENHLIS